VPVEYQGEVLKIGFNAHQLMDALSSSARIAFRSCSRLICQEMRPRRCKKVGEAAAVRPDPVRERVGRGLLEAAVARRDERDRLACEVGLLQVGQERRNRAEHTGWRHEKHAAPRSEIDGLDPDR